MRAALTKGSGGPISVETIDDLDKRAGQVLVDLRVGLITDDDAGLFREGADEAFPVVQGGGGAGMLATGGGSLIEGSRVIIWPRISCRRCIGCKGGHRDGCVDPQLIGRERQGTLAQQVQVPRPNVVNVPSDMGPAYAAAMVDYADAWLLVTTAGVARGSTVSVWGSSALARRVRQLCEALEADITDDGQAVICVDDVPEGSLDELAPLSRIVLDRALDRGAPVDPALVARRQLSMLGAGRGSRSDLVDALLWAAQTGFEPDVGDAYSFDTVGEAFADALEHERSAVVVIE